MFVDGFAAQSFHRREIERKVIESSIAREKWGQLFAFVLAILFGAAGTFLINAGHDVSGCVIAGADLVSIVIVFILGRKYSVSRDVATD